MTPAQRVVALVLVDSAGDVLGALPPFPADPPWAQEAAAIVRGARERHRIDITVLRLLEMEPGVWPGGRLTYLAEVAAAPARVPLGPWRGSLTEHPLRMPWARPGGPAADLEWARSVLADRGLELEEAEQSRTWNLSSLWRLHAGGHDFWFKHVPPFFAHEGRILERLQSEPVPRLVAHDGQRTLLEAIPGEDLYEAPLEMLLPMVEQLVGIQGRWIGRTDELLSLGLPDWRGPAIAQSVAAVVERVAAGLEDPDRQALERFVERLDARLADVASAGIPETLVHGDFHPGNHRGQPGAITLLDWGDSGVGHPLLDQPAFLSAIDEAHMPPVNRRWHELWQAAIPGCDPVRAAQLLAPVAAARQAVIYQKFLDNIEPSEHPYHADDPADWLGRTADLLRQEGSEAG